MPRFDCWNHWISGFAGSRLVESMDVTECPDIVGQNQILVRQVYYSRFHLGFKLAPLAAKAIAIMSPPHGQSVDASMPVPNDMCM
eukprot:6281493-Amphidinium_carterae.1